MVIRRVDPNETRIITVEERKPAVPFGDFLKQLNTVQREAVTSVEGPSLIVAGAGSGKTRVLTFRVAYLLSQGMEDFALVLLKRDLDNGDGIDTRSDQWARTLPPLPVPGGYFQLVDYSAVSDLDDVAFCRWLTIEKGVTAIPLSPFYADPPPGQRLVRLCFAKNDATLDAALERLRLL